MKKLLLSILMLHAFAVFAAENNCESKIHGYRVLNNSTHSFSLEGMPACFFSFYTTNPAPMVDAKGTGNQEDSLWYGYYLKNKPTKIYKFPKPQDSSWGSVCSLESVSFYDMNGDRIPDVTVIGSCDHQNAINYNFTFVFIREGEKYILEEKIYNALFGVINLNIADVRAFAASPKTYHKFFTERYLSH